MAERERDRGPDIGPPVAALFLGIAAARRLADAGEPRPLDAMRKAEEMRSAGKSERAIYAETNRMLAGTEYAGVSYDAAGRPRFEVSDAGAKLKVTSLGRGGQNVLGNVLVHSESARAMPGRDYVAVVHDSRVQGAGLASDKIKLGDKFVSRGMLGGQPVLKNDARGALLHEEQHLAQLQEGRPTGGLPDDFARDQQVTYKGKSGTLKGSSDPLVRHNRYASLAGEQEAELTRSRQDLTAEERRQVHPDDMPYKARVSRSEQIVTYDSAVAAMAKDVEDFGEKIGGARKDSATKTGRKPKTVTETDTRPGWMKRFVAAQELRGGQPTGQWTLLDTRKKNRYTGGAAQAVRQSFASQADAERAIPLLAVSQKHYVRENYGKNADGKYDSSQSTYEVWRKVSDRKQVRAVAETFPTREAAMRYMAENAGNLLGTAKGYGEEILAKPEKVVREGPVWRKGDVDPSVFAKELGYRGVEFGNWQGERGQQLNMAYDAMRDLADITGVRPESLTLQQRLALAFGARGHGGKNAARAHYEPMRAAINLTREGGAGTLAHEWWHATDHYLAQLDDPKLGEMKVGPDGTKILPTDGRETLYASHRVDAKRPGQLNDAVRTAYRELMETMLRKPEQVAVDVSRHERGLANARTNLENQIKSLRDGLARKLEYGKRNIEPATAAQLAKFDEIAAKLMKGEGLDVEWKFAGDANARLGARGSMTYRYQGEALDALSNLYKEVRGRSGFDNQSRSGPMDALAQQMRAVKSAMTQVEEAKKSPTATVMTMTDFVKGARRLDEARTTPYWQTRHELAARAFTSYIEDKLKAAGRSSDYLSFGSDNKFYGIFDDAKPFPEGAERAAINAKFDKLFAAMKAAEVVSPAAPSALAATSDVRTAMQSASGKRPGWSDAAREASAEVRRNSAPSAVTSAEPGAVKSFASVEFKIGEQKGSFGFNRDNLLGTHGTVERAAEIHVRETYRAALADAIDAAAREGRTVTIGGKTTKLGTEHVGGVDTSRDTTRQDRTGRSWKAKAYNPDKVSLFGEVVDFKSKRVAEFAKALGLPEFKSVVAEVAQSAKSLEADVAAPKTQAASAAKPVGVESAVERAMRTSAERAKTTTGTLAKPEDLTLKERMADPRYIPGEGMKQEPYWTRKSPPTPTVADLPPGAFSGTQKEFESLSPGMRREIQRSAEKRAAEGKIGFQNEATLNAALKAQGKAESGKAAKMAAKAKPQLLPEVERLDKMASLGKMAETVGQIAKDARSEQNAWLAERGLTMDQARKLPRAEKEAISIAWAKNKGVKNPEHAGRMNVALSEVSDGRVTLAEEFGDAVSKRAASEVRQSGKRFEVLDNGKPILDSKGKPKWFGSKATAEAFLAKRGTQNPNNLAAINANRAANAAPVTNEAATGQPNVKADIDAATAKAKAGDFKRYVTLGDGRKVSLGQYVAAWKAAKAMPPDATVRGAPNATMRTEPTTAGDALEQFRRGMDDRINRKDPNFGKGRKWDDSWQNDARRLSDTLKRRNEVPAGEAHPVDLRPKIADRLAEGTQLPPKGGTKRPVKTVKLSPDTPPKATPQVAPMKGMAPIGFQNKSTLNAALKAQGKAEAGKAIEFDRTKVGSGTQLRKGTGWKVVDIDVAATEKLYRSNPMYVADDATGGHANRIESIKKAGKPLPVPIMGVNRDKAGANLGFDDGRHRFAAARQAGMKTMPVAMDPESIRNARALGILAGSDTLSRADKAKITRMAKKVAAEGETAIHRAKLAHSANADTPVRKAQAAYFAKALDKINGKLGTVAMITAPIAAAAVAYDATRSQAQAAGSDTTTANAKAGMAAAVAGGTTAGVIYGVGKGIGLGLKLVGKVAPAAAGPVGWAVMGGLTAYGAYRAYQAHKDSGRGGTAAALSLIGADEFLHLGKGQERNLAAGPTRLTADQASDFKAASETHAAMKATESTNTLKGFQNPANLASAMASQGKTWDGSYGKKD